MVQKPAPPGQDTVQNPSLSGWRQLLASLTHRVHRVPSLLMAGILILDQLSKIIARTLLEPGKHYHLLGNTLGFTLHQNNGVAFGLFSWLPQEVSIPLFTLITVAALIYLLRFYLSIPPEKKLSRIALTLIFSGAAGNLLDRLIAGRVTDFFDIARFVPEYRNLWPVFNLADVFIIIGVVLLFFILLIDRELGREKPAKPGSEDSTPASG